MTIERRMTLNPIVAHVTDTAYATLKLMKNEGVQKVPVLDDEGNLKGVITEKDILTATLSEEKGVSLLEMVYKISNLTLDKLMTSDVVSISPSTDIEEVARIMVTQGISFLPVCKDGKLVGLVSKSDMFKIMMELFGARHYGTRISFCVVDRIGALAEISRTLYENNISIISLCTFSDEDPEKVIVTLKVRGSSIKELKELLSPYTAGFVDLGEE